MQEQQSSNRWIIVFIGTFVVLTLIIATVLVKFFDVPLHRNYDESSNQNYATLFMPTSDFKDIIRFSIPMELLYKDKSEYSYEVLAQMAENDTFNFKNCESDYLKYTKEINISDYKTFEDVCVQLFANIVCDTYYSEKEGYFRSLPLNWYNFSDGYDFGLVNLDRLRFKCEFIAQKYGMSTCGNIKFNNEYFSINIYKIPSV